MRGFDPRFYAIPYAMVRERQQKLAKDETITIKLINLAQLALMTRSLTQGVFGMTRLHSRNSGTEVPSNLTCIIRLFLSGGGGDLDRGHCRFLPLAETAGEGGLRLPTTL